MSRVYDKDSREYIKINDIEYGILRKKYAELIHNTYHPSDETKLKQKLARDKYLKDHPEVIEKIRLEVSSRGPEWNLKLSQSHNGYKIICVETGKVYNFLGEAANELNISKGNI